MGCIVKTRFLRYIIRAGWWWLYPIANLVMTTICCLFLKAMFKRIVRLIERIKEKLQKGKGGKKKEEKKKKQLGDDKHNQKEERLLSVFRVTNDPPHIQLKKFFQDIIP